MQASTSEAFPLDISYSEICQWLSSRRKLNRDWIQRLRTIQSRSAKAFTELPIALASQFVATDGGVAEYPTAKDIRDKLVETTERGYFGGLSGEAGIWDKIVKAYEVGNLFIGEAGQRIRQTVDYDIPFLKKRMEQLDKRTQELQRKKTEAENNATSATIAFRKECQDLGITGNNIRHEVLAIGNRIYGILQQGMDELCTATTQNAIKFYKTASRQLHGVDSGTLPTLQEVIDGTVQPPAPDVVKRVDFNDTDASEEQTLVQGDVQDAKAEADGDISWDIAIESDAAAEITGESAEQAVTEIGALEEDDIDWDIEVEQTGETQTTSEVMGDIADGTSVAAAGHDPALFPESKSPAVLRFVCDPQFRHALLDDLYELQAFLMMRNVADMTDAVALTFTDAVLTHDVSHIATIARFIPERIAMLSGDVTQKYLMLKTSQNYTNRQVADLEKKGRRGQEWMQSAMQADQERRSVQTELSQVAIQIGHLSRQTRELKEMVETSISHLFGNRRINIMGKISTIINKY